MWLRRSRQASSSWIVDRLGSADRHDVGNQKIGTFATTSRSTSADSIVMSGACGTR